MLASAIYYKTKLSCHNFTVYDMHTSEVQCYFWHEAEGDLSSNSFTSCIIDYIEEIVATSDDVKEVIIFSDGCTYQNRNVVLANALATLAKEKNITITQKFLERGHTQMEVDSVHSVIERKLKNQQIYVTQNYVDIMKGARRILPYKVRYVDHTFFRNYQEIQAYSSIRRARR